jgi:hypothetical protein
MTAKSSSHHDSCNWEWERDRDCRRDEARLSGADATRPSGAVGTRRDCRHDASTRMHDEATRQPRAAARDPHGGAAVQRGRRAQRWRAAPARSAGELAGEEGGGGQGARKERRGREGNPSVIPCW